MKNILSNILSLVAGVIVSLLIMEAILRVYNPFEIRQKGDEIVLPANVSTNFKNEGGLKGIDEEIKLSKNSIGFRGEELPSDSENFTKIITVGGSTTECRYISDGKDWPALLKKALEKDAPNLWINNAGLDGHSTFGHQILLDDYLLKLKPSMVLFFIGANDVGRSDLNRFDKNNLKSGGGGLKLWLTNNSEIISLIVNIKRSLTATQKGLNYSEDKIDEVPLVEHLDSIAFQKKLDEHSTLIENFESRVENLIATCKANNIQPVLLTQPVVVGEGLDELTGVDLSRSTYCHPDGGKFFWNILEKYNEATRKVALKENITLVDLAQKLPKSTRYFYDCWHFTNEGSQMVAQIVYDELKETFPKVDKE